MNREVKFRALKDDVSNRNWVYGQLVYDAIGTPRITEVDKSGQGLTFHTCIKGTEGQFTGFTDAGKAPLYEDDIFEDDGVHYRISFCEDSGSWIASEIHGDKDGFNLSEFGGHDTVWLQGNAIDNPELLT